MNETKIGIVESVGEFYRLITREILRQRCLVNIQHVGNTVSITAEPHPTDAGRLIGGHAKMYQAMMKLLIQFCATNGGRKSYYVINTDGVKKLNSNIPEEFKPRLDWPEEYLKELLTEACYGLFAKPFDLTFENSRKEPKTKAYLELSNDEPCTMTDAELQDSLSKVFHAIGKANGRLIFLEGLKRKQACSK